MRLELALEVPWAIRPGWLQALSTLAAREPLDPSSWRQFREAYDPAAQSERRGVPLDRTRSVTLRGSVAVVPILGPILPRANLLTEVSGATSLEMLALDLGEVASSPLARATLFDVDSPGGVAAGLDAAAGQIERLGQVMPTAAFVSGLGTSAAYWLAAAAGEIAANETAVLGSIGVAVMVPRQEAPDQEGRVDYEIVSSGAPNKRPDPSSEAGEAQIRALLDSTEDIFVEAVARLRGVTPERVRDPEGFGAGGMVSGREALARGMIDRLDSFENSLARLAARAGLTAAVA